MEEELAPIVLFTYKRLDTLKLTVEALKKNTLAKESTLIVFSDGAKTDNDVRVVSAVRTYVNSIVGFKHVQVYESRLNKGLATSIIDGITQVFDQFNEVIVLEDDLSTTPNFLTFMNASLQKYELEKKAFSISGYSFDLGIDKSANPKFDGYFLNRGWSWGWATWKDRWLQVDWNVSDYNIFIADRSAQKAFAQGGSDLNGMLARQMSGSLDSWAIRWFYHQFKNKGLTLYPVFSKVFNNGFDDLATHTSGSSRRYQPLLDKTFRECFFIPDTVQVNLHYQRRFARKMGIVSRIISKGDTMLKKIFRGFN
jgi:hypothetical protein